MSEWQSHIMINFFIRAIVGIVMIFFVNQFLASKGIALHVGMNPLTFVTSGTFGAPGVALLYGIAFYQGL